MEAWHRFGVGDVQWGCGSCYGLEDERGGKDASVLIATSSSA